MKMRISHISIFLLCILFVFSLSPAQNHENPTAVKFTLKWDKPAKKIALIGSFNNFSKNADLLSGPDSAGVWQIAKKLPYGTYEYRFLVDDEIYLRDPQNPNFGGINSNSILYLDPPSKPHIQVLSPLPGEKITGLPLQIRIHFLPGSESDMVDLKRSEFSIDGRLCKLNYDYRKQILSAEIPDLAEGEHTIYLRIEDKKNNQTRDYNSIFVVNAENQPPVAEAGYSLFCRPRETISLDGGLSYDPDLDNLVKFRWRSLDADGAAAFDTSGNTPFPSVTIFQPGDYRFALATSDGSLWSRPDTTAVYCRSFPQTAAQFRLNQGVMKSEQPLQSVSVAGEFNRWQAGVDNLADSSGTGTWKLRKPLRPGVYEYKFVLNGSDWIPDPGDRWQVEDGWKGVNSVLQIKPFFTDTLQWDFHLQRRGLLLQNSLHHQFTLLQDVNNPQTVPVKNDSIFMGKTGPGSYFLYAESRDSGNFRAPKHFLLNNAGHGETQIVDFADSPGWASRAVTYQVYLRKFGPDSARSGTLNDVRQRLDYLQDLGINCVWLMPIMPSPTEHGYTPVDYFDVEPDYGTLADFDSLVADLHRRGMKLFFDFVANHSSDQHPYFLSAWANPNSVFRDWYIWHGPRKYEFHNDWDQLPNLNYDNPSVRHFILRVAKFWIDRGVDGLRCDAAWGVPHNFWKDFRRKVKSWNPQVVLLDEVLPRDPAYHDLEFDMSYDTDFYGNVLDVFRGRKSVEGLRFGLEKTRTNYPRQVVDLRYIENQDMERFVSQFGPDAARAAAALLYTLPGMPLVYYGQEVGLKSQRGSMRWELTGNGTFQFYRELLHLRNENSAFISGNLGFLQVSHPKSVLAYLRKQGNQEFAVIINFRNEPLNEQVDLPPPANAYYAFGSQELGPGIHRVNLKNIQLKAFGFLILRIESTN